ncbi:flagellar basal body L-ring protein FlgH [Salidesulfovibrio onnuriiensis]|uniref:flagellar basal body L-ring protein FlgH n=1 Tax=Salidesulfovibrio onnuriiensis TaxID=2583823 RepID=UPI0011C94FF7|nr:flagellar basal body L-ring protein FlgH [Salidesulfovibrio onnuriiensis]
MKILNTTTMLVMMTAFALLAGCAPRQEPTPMPVLTEPQILEEDPAENPGSLFQESQAEYLFEDNRARRVGDIVMVKVAESSSSKLTADTTAKRDTQTDMGITAMPSTGLIGNLPLGALGAKAGMNVEAGAKNDFTGSGEVEQEATFTATVATRIVRRLPGGVLQVEGARRIRVYNETQILVVRGLIRDRDILSDNSISSNALAEAQIEVYGQGVLADKQKPGWLSRLLDNIYPF